MSATHRHPRAGDAGAEDMVKDFWATRPRRPRRGRKIAGVAAGIANRYRIDPTLVRVGFLVAAIYGGAGVLLYLLGWLLLPEQDDEVSPLEALIGKGRSSTSTVFTIVLGLAVVPVFGWALNGFFPGWMGLLIAVGLLYLLHRNRGDVRPADAEPAAQPVTDVPLPTVPVMPMATYPPPYQQPYQERAEQEVPAREEQAAPEPERVEGPPAWDPLGAAPFAWDLPDPTPVHVEPDPPPPPGRKSKVGFVTVAVALIAAGVLAALSTTNSWVDGQHAVGVVLAVIGVGMVIGSFVRGGRGLIGLAVPLALVGIGMTTVTPDGWNGVGDITARPVSSAQVSDEYERSVGDITIDLTRIPATDDEIHTRAKVDVGNVTIIVPRNADVELECQVGAGNIDCLEAKQHEMVDGEVSAFLSEGPDGRGGLQIDLDAEVATAGNVEVRRG